MYLDTDVGAESTFLLDRKLRLTLWQTGIMETGTTNVLAEGNSSGSDFADDKGNVRHMV